MNKTSPLENSPVSQLPFCQPERAIFGEEREIPPENLPHSLEAEKAFLYYSIWNYDALKLFPDINATHFHFPRYGAIMQAVLNLRKRNASVEFVNIVDELRKQGTLKLAGGPDAVGELDKQGVFRGHPETYASLLREKLALRQLIVALRALQTDAENGQNISLIAARGMDKLASIKDFEISPEAAMAQELEDCRFRFNCPPEIPKPIFRISNCTVLTPGNLLSMAAHAKTGKSTMVSAFAGATMGGKGDCLGVESENEQGAAVIHIDTEQSLNDRYTLCVNAAKRAGINGADIPDWFLSYSFVCVERTKRISYLKFLLQEARTKYGAIHSVILDGVVDFVRDPNDQHEAISLIGELHQLAIEYQMGFVLVLHFNPGTDSFKTRGHIGSEIERKVETSLMLEKSADGTTTVYTKNARHAPISKAQGVLFRWSNVESMHVAVLPEPKLDAPETLKRLARAVFLVPEFPFSLHFLNDIFESFRANPFRIPNATTHICGYIANYALESRGSFSRQVRPGDRLLSSEVVQNISL